MRKKYDISGMHCRSCEVLIEQEVKKIPGIKKVVASTKKRELAIEADRNVDVEVLAAIKNAGYKVGADDVAVINKSGRYWLEFLGGSALLLFFYLILKGVAPESLLSPTSFTGGNLLGIFGVGLLAGISSCMALVGGLILGISARHAEQRPNATTKEKFRPHLFFNLGRIASYFILGGVLGEIGSIIQINGFFVGMVTLFVAMVMFFLGLQLTEISPKFSHGLTLPKSFSKLLGDTEKEYSHGRAFWAGGATFFLPCGFTQAVQVFAISSGSFWSGALIMFAFALGTAPGLLTVGGFSAGIKNNRLGKFIFRTVGILILILALYNLKNGVNLIGLRLSQSSSDSQITAVQEGDFQVIRAIYDPKSPGEQYVIEPKEFTVKVGQPVRFEVLAKQNGLGCMGSITLPGLQNKFEVFEEGKTATFEFTPKRTGVYKITCAMGIESGTINVVK